MASTYLTRTVSSGADITKCTFSFWVKRSKLGADQRIFSNENTTNKQLYIRFNSNDTFTCYARNGASSNAFSFDTNRVFRDVSAYYHICIKFDSTQSTEADRFKFYVNGVAETSFSSASYPSLNEVAHFTNSSEKMNIGYNDGGNNQYFDGCLSHVHFTQGYAYDASTFGSTDATTGEWQINTSPSITMGTNGFTILKDGNTITDQSSNSNDFTSGGTLTKTEDNPSNVFCTWNSLTNVFNDKFIMSNGNTTWNSYSTGSSVSHPMIGTIGLTKGKWYWENYVNTSHSGDHCLFGVTSRIKHTNAQYNHLGSTADDYAYHGHNGHILNNTGSANNGTAYGATFTTGDYIGVFLDLDNNKIYFSKNGTVQNSGTGHSITDPASTPDGCYYPAVSDYHYAPIYVVKTNFGNGVFGTTALTGTTYDGADGNGIFKYEPTGLTLDSATKSFNAISTKGLNA